MTSRPDGGSSPDTGSSTGPDAGAETGLEPLEIRTLSNRADLISGGDAYVEIVLPSGTSAAGLMVTLGGRDVVSDSFAQRANGRVLGLITGLANGDNIVTASLAGKRGAALTINNHPIGGPLFSGPQILPWICATPSAQPATGSTPATSASGLSTSALDAQCNIATEMKLYYRSTSAGCTSALPDPNPPASPPDNPCFKPYDPAASRPADLATATTDQGRMVPYIVRVERGTINRGIYDIAVLFDPTADWKPYAPQADGTKNCSIRLVPAPANRACSRGLTAAGSRMRRSRAASWSPSTC